MLTEDGSSNRSPSIGMRNFQALTSLPAYHGAVCAHQRTRSALKVPASTARSAIRGDRTRHACPSSCRSDSRLLGWTATSTRLPATPLIGRRLDDVVGKNVSGERD